MFGIGDVENDKFFITKEQDALNLLQVLYTVSISINASSPDIVTNQMCGLLLCGR